MVGNPYVMIVLTSRTIRHWQEKQNQQARFIESHYSLLTKKETGNETMKYPTIPLEDLRNDSSEWDTPTLGLGVCRVQSFWISHPISFFCSQEESS